jgi:predicted metal-dependent peptidase
MNKILEKDMDAKERIKKITEFWFLTEPLIFAAYCTHELSQNENMQVPFRTGKKRIEFNPAIIDGYPNKLIAEYLKIEVFRILLKHPYQRLPTFPNRKVLAYASNITIADCYKTEYKLAGVNRWPLKEGLCFEEYYNKIFAILSTPPEENADSGESIIPPENKNQTSDEDDFEHEYSTTLETEEAEQLSALWEEDEEVSCTINNLIEIAESSNTWGNISGNLQELIKASKTIAMDYRKMLSAFRTSILSSKRRLTRMRPNRRFGFAFMGSRYALATNLLVAVDVSGSVSSRSLMNFFSIINRFFKYGIEKLDVIQFDHELKTKYPLPFKKAKSEVKIVGRGGTSFQPAADYYCSHPEYDGLIYFTDGWAAVPEFNTKRIIDVLWIITNKGDYERHKDWIKKIAHNRATYIPE